MVLGNAPVSNLCDPDQVFVYAICIETGVAGRTGGRGRASIDFSENDSRFSFYLSPSCYKNWDGISGDGPDALHS